MVSTPNPLWERLERYHPDVPGHHFPFSAKLAHEQGWSAEFSQRAIFEYKRFVYLCCISPTGASPPPIVDAVWHLHLTYTRSYWQEFCPKVLGQDLHHNPSAGGTGEQERHRNWYADTLRLYDVVFDGPPPPDIWPPAEAKGDHPDPEKLSRPGFATLLLILSILAFIPAFFLSGPAFLICFTVFLCWCAVLYRIYHQAVSRTLHSALFSETSPGIAELAFLSGNTQRVRQAVFADGILRNALRREGDDWIVDLDRLRNDGVFYASWLGESTRIPELDLLRMIDAQAAQVAGKYRPLIDWVTRDRIPYLILYTPLAVAGLRVAQGVYNSWPVAYLVAESILYVCIAGYQQLIPAFHHRMSRVMAADSSIMAMLSTLGVAGVVAMSGMRSLAAEPEFSGLGPSLLGDWRESRRPVFGSDSSGSGCGSSCSGDSSCGSSCGGGCGGCGGGD